MKNYNKLLNISDSIAMSDYNDVVGIVEIWMKNKKDNIFKLISRQKNFVTPYGRELVANIKTLYAYNIMGKLSNNDNISIMENIKQKIMSYKDAFPCLFMFGGDGSTNKGTESSTMIDPFLNEEDDYCIYNINDNGKLLFIDVDEWGIRLIENPDIISSNENSYTNTLSIRGKVMSDYITYNDDQGKGINYAFLVIGDIKKNWNNSNNIVSLPFDKEYHRINSIDKTSKKITVDRYFKGNGTIKINEFELSSNNVSDNVFTIPTIKYNLFMIGDSYVHENNSNITYTISNISYDYDNYKTEITFSINDPNDPDNNSLPDSGNIYMYKISINETEYTNELLINNNNNSSTLFNRPVNSFIKLTFYGVDTSIFPKHNIFSIVGIPYIEKTQEVEFYIKWNIIF